MSSFSLNIPANELLWSLADASLRAVVLAGLVAVLTLFLRRRAAAQHAMWTFMLIAMLLLPVLRRVVPAAHVSVAPLPTPVWTSIAPAIPAATGSRSTPELPPLKRTETASYQVSWPLYAALAYMAGALFFLARLLSGMLLTRKLLREARSIEWELGEYVSQIANAGVDVTIEESSRVRVPVTIGFWRMRIILPAEWREWPAGTMKAVLAHELAHVRRRDPLIALAAVINKCVFWFHPLAWWLNRRLAVLAEYAADEAGIVALRDAESYGRVVLEVASRMGAQNNRLVWHTSAMNGPLLGHRIRRVMDPLARDRVKRLGKAAWTTLAATAVLLVGVCIAVDFQGAARAQATRPAAVDDGSHLGFYSEGPSDSTTAEEAAQMEQQLATNPEDEATRARLLSYFWRNKMHDRRIPLVLWLIDNHPESPLHGHGTASISLRGLSAGGGPAVFEDAKNRWLAQVNRHPGDARVLWNAARALGAGSLRDWVDLAKRARSLEPAKRTKPLALLFALVLEWSTRTDDLPANMKDSKDSGLVAEIRSELQLSNDVTLIGAVAHNVVQRATEIALTRSSGTDLAAFGAIAYELVSHAQRLEPQNQEWSDLMEGVKGLPAEPVQPATPPDSHAAKPAVPQVLRIGGGVAHSMLRKSFPPVYPAEAGAAGIEGVVTLQVRVREDGHVAEATLVTGHPLLVQAAIDAVKRYEYQPIKVDGKPVEFVAPVEVAVGPGRE